MTPTTHNNTNASSLDEALAAYDLDDSDPAWHFTRETLAAAYGPCALMASLYTRETGLFISKTCTVALLPVLLCASSTLYCLRVFTKRPLNDPQRFAVATVCILLAAEVDEYPYVPNDAIIDAAWRVYQESHPNDTTFATLEDFTDAIRRLRYTVFEQLAWKMRVKHPYSYLPFAVTDMRDPEARFGVLREAWLLVTTSYLSPSFLLFRPIVLACAAAAVGAERLQRAISAGTVDRWVSRFKIDPNQLTEAREFLHDFTRVSLPS
jgi:hypothetical protein